MRIETLKSLTIILHVSSASPDAAAQAGAGSNCVSDYILVKCKEIRFL